MKTYSLRPKEITRKWYLIDASMTPLGRISTAAARLLLGKDKPSSTPHMDSGDYVVIVNSDQLVMTGGKEGKKVYFRHSGFPGGIHKRSLGQMKDLDSKKVIEHAVRGMLPDNKLRKQRLARLKIYASSEHGHQAQSPEAIEVGKKGSNNGR